MNDTVRLHVQTAIERPPVESHLLVKPALEREVHLVTAQQNREVVGLGERIGKAVVAEKSGVRPIGHSPLHVRNAGDKQVKLPGVAQGNADLPGRIATVHRAALKRSKAIFGSAAGDDLDGRKETLVPA